MFYILDPVFRNEIVIRHNAGQEVNFKEIQKVWTQFSNDYPLELNYVEDQINSLYGRETELTRTLTLFSLLTIIVIAIGLDWDVFGRLGHANHLPIVA